MMQQWADYLDDLAEGGKVIVHPLDSNLSPGLGTGPVVVTLEAQLAEECIA
jgi:hypothetical protein